MKIYTTNYITGKNLETLGLVEGSTVQSKHIGRDLAASFKTIVGGELKGYTEMMNEARKVATARMIEQAEAMGADAVIEVRYSSSAVMDGAAEIMAYGTAVKFI
ncbi:MAG: YbjQ family protein [Clostridia bacterium]|nr:YbjQ family protein [Clostridia bacterium]